MSCHSRQLDIVQEVQKKMLVAYEEMKQEAHTAKLELRLREEERDLAVAKTAAQKQVHIQTMQTLP